MSTDIKIDRQTIIQELKKREGEKTFSFEVAYNKGKTFINKLGK